MTRVSNGKDKTAQELNTEKETVMVFPFAKDESASPKYTPSVIKGERAPSPLDLLKKSVKQNAGTEKNEPKLTKDEQKLVKLAENINKPAEPKTKPKNSGSLLAKCMPYIYDDKGISQVDDKPDYTLESVEDIIEAAEKRANQKIAQMYNLRNKEVESISAEKKDETVTDKPRLINQSTSIKKAIRIGEPVSLAPASFDTVSLPKITDTLFDDFSGRRTEMVEQTKVSVAYSEISEQDSSENLAQTRAIPDLKPETHTEEIYEDILSHTRPVNVKDIPSVSRPTFVPPVEDEPRVKVDDFKGENDITRVGSSLKFDLVMSRLKLIATALLTLVAGALHIPYLRQAFGTNQLLPAIITLSVFGIAVLVNFNIFSSFKTAFTQDAKIELPLALAVGLSAGYLIFGIIRASYPYELAVLPMVSLLVYDYCAYRQANTVFCNFKSVAARRSKFALSLINDPSVTYPMARSSIDGEVLASGCTETDEIDDFLKNTLSTRAFSGKLGTLAIVNIIVSVALGITVGISYASFESGLAAVTTALCLGAAPTLFISELLPFASFADKLRDRQAVLCSRYSAEKIEQINAAVISSADLFPEGCIKLFNINPLSANNIDQTITEACAVAKAVNSPLFPMLLKMLTDDTELPKTDTAKYEENLGISGWAADHHIMIGNRSMMISHGVRIPPLEVDRKILHKGYFPIYIASDQRACALLTVRYTIDRAVEAELERLANAGVTLLIDNCDPNITEEMLCDYYSLYPDIIRIMDSGGIHKYRSATAKTDHASAHAFHKGSSLGYLSLLTSSMRLKSLTNILYILHIICTVVIWILFLGLSLGGGMTLMNAALCLMCEAVSTIITAVAYFIGKPFHD